ncbi:unnamed protein product [Acanthoscelides obtectus]|uniref:C2H2-type domain-containing protein n=1 Tax=Acanthoscelides obtectus TaxID=200917 RepID=A0A9P0JZI4_ACAOB|nr:unnamed protein product [Acanthoscelides obtectus]CAK1669644.1 hypothetical protein AOBTE_LOCUS27124 [Acanthoscelides obtectus]
MRCGKSYTMKCNLRRHQRVECGKAKTNVCFICKKSYYYRQELNIHMSVKHRLLHNILMSRRSVD